MCSAQTASATGRSAIVRAMRKAQLLIVVVAACGGPKPASPTPPQTPPASPPVEEAAKPPPAAPAPVAVDATPDKPSGADAARDAELAKAATSVVDAFVNGANGTT